MFRRYFTLNCILLCSFFASAQDTTGSKTSSLNLASKPHPISFAASLNANYSPENGGVSLTPLASIEWRKVILRLRYNYETANTFYASIGYDVGNDSSLVWWSIRPYIGTSFGRVKNISPELAFDIGYGIFGLSGDVEYTSLLQGPNEKSRRAQSDNTKKGQLYTWAELYVEPAWWMYTGITAQRNEFFHSKKALDAGVIVGFLPGSFDISLQASSFWDSNRYFVLGVTYYFQTGQSKRYKNSL